MFEEKLTIVKDKEYIVNLKFNVVVHLPLKSWTDFDLVFLADSGTVMYKEHIQDKIKNIVINEDKKICFIEWK